MPYSQRQDETASNPKRSWIRVNVFERPTLKDFAEMGAHQGGQMVFTAEYIRRYFGVPKKRDSEDAIYTEEYVEHVRGASHVILEKVPPAAKARGSTALAGGKQGLPAR